MTETLTDAPPPFRGTEIHQLPNGLKLILKSDPTVPVVAIQAWARCGAVDESPKIYGISHGLEHMVFKGTPTRSAGDITRDIESQGGAINAATQLETTHYYIDVPSYGMKNALNVLADTILHPTFPKDELIRERLVILEEIYRRNDSPEAMLWDEFASSVFSGTPYGIKVIGNEKTVSAMSRDDLFTYFRKHYVPSNLSIVIVGDFKKDAVLKQLQKLFRDFPAGKAPAKPVVNLASGKKREAVSIKRPVQLSYFAFGTPTVGIGHPDAVAMDLLSDVLCGGSSARFYQSLREEKQLLLGISCEYIPFEQKGLFAFFGDTLPDKFQPAVDALIFEIENLQNNPIKPEELARAKARIKSDWLHGSETAHGQASTLGSLNAAQHVELVSSFLSSINKLAIEDLMRVAKKYLTAQDFQLTSIQPEN